MNENTLIASLVFGTFGMAYFVYGKKQGKASALLAGVALMVIPYVLPGLVPMILASLVLLALPFFI